MSKKKILLLHTGGTIGMGLPKSALSGRKNTGLVPNRHFAQHLKKSVPELWRLAQLEVRSVSHKDSSEITIKDWLGLAQIIEQEQDRYDGFVVTHGTDTMVYTGTALSYLLPWGSKPVVITGSQKPLSDVRNDARRNLINSLALMRIYEVTIFFDTYLLRANRSKKVHIEEFHAFDSKNFPPLAEERLHTQFLELPRERISRPDLKPVFDPHIQILRMYPGCDPQLERGTRAVVLDGFGCGNIPSHALPFLKKCATKKIPVVLTSQVSAGGLAPELYAAGKSALDLGAVSSGDMTFEATLIKCMLLAGNDVPYTDWPKWIKANWAGEISNSTLL